MLFRSYLVTDYFAENKCDQQLSGYEVDMCCAWHCLQLYSSLKRLLRIISYFDYLDNSSFRGVVFISVDCVRSILHTFFLENCIIQNDSLPFSG